jgi:cysteine desulfurase
MDLMGINVSTGSACDSKETQISHVLKATNLEERLAKGTIRISLGHQNTEQDVQMIVDVLAKIIGHPQ